MWAYTTGNAYQQGLDACNLRFNNYLKYVQSAAGMSPLLPDQALKLMQCNDFPLTSFAGFNGGAGGTGGMSDPGFQSAHPYFLPPSGYTPDFLSAMMGPFLGAALNSFANYFGFFPPAANNLFTPFNPAAAGLMPPQSSANGLPIISNLPLPAASSTSMPAVTAASDGIIW
jgi:hypothetical protein